MKMLRHIFEMRSRMPIFEKYNLLFIHIPKTAGGSIEQLLSAVCSQTLTSRHRFFDLVARVLVSNEKNSKHLFGIVDKRLVLQHLTPNEILGLGYLSHQDYLNKNRFTVIRNPIDRAVSLYFSHNRYSIYESFDEFVDQFIFGNLSSHNDVSHRRSQVDFTMFGNKLDSDLKIIRFESLQNDLSKYLKSIGCHNTKLPRKNLGFKKPADFKISQVSKRKLEDYYTEDLNFWHTQF